MHNSLKNLKEVTLPKYLLIVIAVFLACCNKQSTFISDLTKEERKDLEYFFGLLMLYDSGAFVLFGSKPLCDSGFYNHVAERENSPYERNPINGWKVWEKIKDKIHPCRYQILMEQTERLMDGEMKPFTHFVLIDVKKVALVFAENYEIFKNYFGTDFHPLKVALEFGDPNSQFWKKLIRFDESMTNGLLYGFGKQNVLFWTWEKELEKDNIKVADFFNSSLRSGSISDNEPTPFGSWDPENLFVPGFIVFGEDEITEKYKKERDRIKQIYKGKDFLEVTLQQFTK